MMSENRTLSITLAALLRDIDLVAQRAGEKPGASLPLVSDSVKAIWKSEADLLNLASTLAYGAPLTAADVQPLHLKSVFCEVGDSPPPPQYFPLHSLSLAEEAIFPQTLNEAMPTKQARTAYLVLWQAIRQGMQRLASIQDLESSIEGAYLLLQTHAWCIPAAVVQADAISLFDHSRTTAAMAACLCAFERNEIAELSVAWQPGQAESGQAVACLVGGDLSGVQHFLYTITARGATSSLRGRSFYLQLLTETIARFVLRRLGLSTANLIYCGGGRFYILAPAPAADRMEDVQKELDGMLLQHHDGELYLALGAVPLTASDFAQECFANAWRRTNNAVSERKRRRFATQGESLFAMRDVGGDETRDCQVCHTESNDVKLTARDEDDNAKVRKCALCRSLEELGRNLRDASAILLAQVSGHQESPGTWQGMLAALGFHVAIRRSNNVWTALPHRADRATLVGLYDTPELDDSLRRQVHCPIVEGLRWMVNVAPLRSDGQRATFEDLQNAATGLRRLGVLRMDVDNLGVLFSDGFQRHNARGERESSATLTRLAGLSAALDRYFEGWVGEVCRETNREFARGGNELVYAIYSGGDDLFLVGAWDILPELAHRIRHDFGRFAAGNPSLHLSAGITLHGGKEPLYQAAESAGDALEAAKGIAGKDALNFLGLSVRWADWQAISERRDVLLNVIATDGAASVLTIISSGYLDYLETAANWQERGLSHTEDGKQRTIWGPYLWRMTYRLRRLAERYPGADSAVEEWIRQLSRPQALTWLALAARWTDALTRTAQEQERRGS